MQGKNKYLMFLLFSHRKTTSGRIPISLSIKSVTEIIGHNNLSLKYYFRKRILCWQYRVAMFEYSSTVTVD